MPRDAALPDELIRLLTDDVIPPRSLPRWRARLQDRTGPSPSLHEVTTKLVKTAQRHRVLSDDTLAAELAGTQKRLMGMSRMAQEGPLKVRRTREALSGRQLTAREVQPTRLPDVLQLLLELSRPPDLKTRSFADELAWDRAHPVRLLFWVRLREYC